MSAFYASPNLDETMVDPVFWGDEHKLHEAFTWLRENTPVRRLEPNGYDAFWAITKYNDIKAIEGNKTLWLNDPRPTLGPKMIQAFVEQSTGRRHLVRSLVQMDDPDHSKYRALTQSWFLGGNLRKLQSTVDALAVQYVDRLAELGGECDFVKDVAIWYPLRVIMSILGVPEEDEPLMMKLTQELFGSSDPDVNRSFEMTDFLNVVQDFEAYFRELTAKRRANPQNDVGSVIANSLIDGQPIPDHEANGYYTITATAGHDTTSSTTAGGLLALIQNPEQMHKLRADPDAHMASAVDEMIRWVSPVRHFMRTASADCEVGGQAVKAGESAILWYPSANRDAEIFDDPFSFKVDRSGPKQLAFGFGTHVCLGQHLARMEINALYRELLRRVDHIELAGEPKYMQTTFVGGLKSLPIRYRMK